MPPDTLELFPGLDLGRGPANGGCTTPIGRRRNRRRRLAVMCEAAGMAPQLYRITEPYGIAVLSGGGFDSIPDKHRLGEEWAAVGQPVTVLRIGDYDASGASMHIALMEDVIAFAQEYGGDVEFVQVAITPEQARSRNLPSSPPKPTPRRTFQRRRDLAGRSARP